MKQQFILLIFCFLLFLACTKEKQNVVNLEGNKIVALGHAGMGIGNRYPMNSYESILKCLNLGMDGTEFDVQMTKDSILVAFHHQELDRRTNATGTINSLTWKEIKNIRYSQTPYLNYPIISVEDLFTHLDNLSRYKFTFDCKLYTENQDMKLFYTNYINAMDKLIQKFDLEDNVYIESQSVDFLKLIQLKNPKYKLFIYPSSFESGLKIAEELNLYGITISTRDITKEQIQLAHNVQKRVAIWNTHSYSANVEAVSKNPDFIQTDRVKHLVKLVK